MVPEPVKHAEGAGINPGGGWLSGDGRRQQVLAAKCDHILRFARNHPRPVDSQTISPSASHSFIEEASLTSPDGDPFTGVVFHIDAVSQRTQRTVAELEARANPFWLMFAPLAVDADPDSVASAVSALGQRTTRREFEDLTAAMVVMAQADKRRRRLKDAIIPLLNEEHVVQNWFYKQGEAHGEARGEANSVLRVLRARGVSVPDDVRDRILAEQDTAKLEAWLDRAVVAVKAEDVLNGH